LCSVLKKITKNLKLENTEIDVFNALSNFFCSEQLVISEPWIWGECYDSEEHKDEEYAWAVTNKNNCVGSLHFGRKHQYSTKKFYWSPNHDVEVEYCYVLTECVPKEMRPFLWTEEETNTLLYSTSDARSECHTY
jgi:hypothetical protein